MPYIWQKFTVFIILKWLEVNMKANNLIFK